MASSGVPLQGVPARVELWTVRLEVPHTLIDSLSDILSETSVALTVLAPPRKAKANIEAIFSSEPNRAQLTSMVAVAVSLLNAKMPLLQIERVPDLNWLRKVAADFPPLPIARWVVHGAHHRGSAPDRRHALQIDATNAFGTGEHPTTRGCLMMLADMLKKKRLGPKMLDMGCGSGILAMAWAKAERGQAVGIDCDRLSVQIAKGNAEANGLRSRLSVALGQGYIGRLVKSEAPFDLIMANIFARPLAAMAKDLRRNLKPGGVVILSGLLNSQVNLVLAAHRMQKIYPVKCFRLGEWSVLVLKRKGAGKLRRSLKTRRETLADF